MADDTRTLRYLLFKSAEKARKDREICAKIWTTAVYANQDIVKSRVCRLLKAQEQCRTAFKRIDGMLVKLHGNDIASSVSSSALQSKPEACAAKSFSSEAKNKRKINDESADGAESSSEHRREIESHEYPKYKMEDNNIPMVVLGPNNTKVPKDCFDKISWDNINTATHDLLDIVVSQNALAKRDLTAKRSSSLNKRSANVRMDPLVVKDIESLLRAKFNVTLKEIRLIIRRKFTDTAKRFKKNE